MQNNIPKSVFAFLSALKKNNNRDWFAKNKPNYQKQHALVCDFAEQLILEMNKRDQIETPTGKKACFRIYRDVRFSKDKSPYKTNMGLHLKRATAKRRGGYYIHISPSECFIGGGFWAPSSADLKHIRAQIASDASVIKKGLNHKDFKRVFGTLQGEKVKTAPKGYSKDHPEIDLLRYKQFLASKSFSDADFQKDNFIKTAVDTLDALRPFFDAFSEMLTTDLNGESRVLSLA